MAINPLSKRIRHSLPLDKNSPLISPQVLFAVAFAVRIIAIPTSFLRLNPYSTSDVLGFGNAASIIAHRITAGSFTIALSGQSRIYEVWGTILSPFWLLPGSQILAHLFVALLGALSVLNVVLIVRRLSTPRAAFIAALPLIFYPSIVLVQSTILRESAVLFGITTAACLAIGLPSSASKFRTVLRLLLITLAIAFATILRYEALPVYFVSIIAAIIAMYWETLVSKAIVIIAVLATFIGIQRLAPDMLSYLNRIRERRAHGRAIYFADMRFQDILGAAGFAIIGSAYFLFAPFPWMINTPSDALVGLEGLGNIIYFAAGVIGVKWLIQRDRYATVGLAVFVIVGVGAFGLGTVNYGAAVRHRQMFLWAIFVFGAIGIERILRQHDI